MAAMTVEEAEPGGDDPGADGRSHRIADIEGRSVDAGGQGRRLSRDLEDAGIERPGDRETAGADEDDHDDGKDRIVRDQPQGAEAERQSREAADDIAEDIPVGQAPADDDTDERTDAEGSEDCGNEVRGQAGHLSEQRGEVGEGREHRSLEQRRRAQSQPDSGSFERSDLGTQQSSKPGAASAGAGDPASSGPVSSGSVGFASDRVVTAMRTAASAVTRATAQKVERHPNWVPIHVPIGTPTRLATVSPPTRLASARPCTAAGEMAEVWTAATAQNPPQAKADSTRRP